MRSIRTVHDNDDKIIMTNSQTYLITIFCFFLFKFNFLLKCIKLFIETETVFFRHTDSFNDVVEHLAMFYWQSFDNLIGYNMD